VEYNKLVEGESPLNHYYVNNDGQTVYYFSGNEGATVRIVYDFWVVIKEKRYNVGDNSFTFRLVGEDIYGTKLDVNVSAKLLFGHNTDLLSMILPWFHTKCEENTKQGDTLRKIIKDLTPDQNLITAFDRIMWQNNNLIIPSMEPEGCICTIDKKRYPYDMPEDLDLWTGLKALDYIIESVGIHNIMPLITLVFMSPVIGKMFPDDRYGYAVIGETGSLKTAICRLLLQIYGNGFGSKSTMLKMGDAGTTRNSVGIFAAISGCMPILLDNFKPYKHWSTSELAALIHNLMEGADKTRGTKDEGLRDVKEFFCLPLLTGEDYAVDASTSARIMRIDWKKPDMDILDFATPEMRRHLPAIGRIWLRWLMTDEGIAAMEQMKREFPERRQDLMKEFKDLEATNPDRLSTNLALESLGFELLAHHPVLGNYFAKFSDEFKGKLRGRAESVGKATSEGSEVNNIVEMLREGLANGTLILGNDPRYGQTIIGSEFVSKKTGERCIAIYPQALEEYISKHLTTAQQLSTAAIGQYFLNKGLIIPDPKGNPKQAVWLQSSKTTIRAFVFKKETLIDESMNPDNVVSSPGRATA
jgi:hypothetical protein